MIRLNTDQMRKRLTESYNFIYTVEEEELKRQKQEHNERTKDTQVGNG